MFTSLLKTSRYIT